MIIPLGMTFIKYDRKKGAIKTLKLKIKLILLTFNITD